jgi:hypothetical protein
MGFELTTLVLIGTDCIGSWIYVHDHDRPLFSYHMEFSVTGQEKGDLLIQVTAQ